MSLYSFKGQKPEELPERVVLENGESRTSLHEYTDEELSEFGFTGPIIEPEFDKETEKLVWNEDTIQYDKVILTQEELQFIVSEKKKRATENIDYTSFHEKVTVTKFYRRLRSTALNSDSNLLYALLSDFMTYISECRLGIGNQLKVQHSINILFLNFDTYHPAEDEDILDDFKVLMNETGMDSVYTIPDKEWVDTHTYDRITNSYAGPQPFASWELVLAKWEPPFMPPNDGKDYVWDESSVNWVESTPPYPSWTVVNGVWESPYSKPGNDYVWNEETLKWIQTS